MALAAISQEDLFAFHRKHFPDLPKPCPLFVTASHQSATQAHGEGDDDDNVVDHQEESLGYYPDGTQRYLTDEQVEIFRHSELQRALRQRTDLATSRSGSPAQSPDCIGQDSQPSATLTRTRKRRQKARQRKKRQRLEANTTPQDLQRNTSTSQSRRFWDNFIDDDSQHNPHRHTHRRLAREMDAQGFETTELSYDD